MEMSTEDRFIASDLLIFAKSGVRNVSLLITETTTPFVREALLNQLIQGVQLHAQVFNFLYAHGVYPSHSVERVIQGNIRDAQIALSKPIHQ
ncbi:hypothetical protein SD70_07230 [Gordoniibacillus kamchatkensis]|uniref:Spore coat protein n=1 Tax=Gordoniibacillus kamchatkensis TaxID=1590651 RepID=A0ABR5AK63_9BACL|nr:spore coat protein [Paenibacillus sp. VKM B-2647]KIL41428.1 hypothetical protein SD70_07230 [Paenibacillus sp. VKM B-2647]